MTIDKAQLKALAEAANAVTTDVNITMAVGSAPEEVKAVQDFLQQAMPKTILALLAEIERLSPPAGQVSYQQQMEAWKSASSQDLRARGELMIQVDELKAENETLRKDAQRYRWLRDKQTFIWLIQDWFPGEAMLTNVDADIDAAMAKEAGHG
ncbi:hypothetical protein AO392_14590 [Pseudomonas putida]|uniref:hypothetical protein n=1 Tax=Pseudomonas putida TaxID=303 RepID=UPI00072FFB14|nr:hypothetical protein [Pseudomonas putida]KTC25449.1 hypothetical protein AO392_14590 [Pseudomonas putida]